MMGSSQARHLDLRGSMRLLYYSAPQAHSSNLGREVVVFHNLRAYVGRDFTLLAGA